MSEVPEELRKQMFQEVGDLDENISGVEMELLERNRILEEWLKEGRNAEVEEGRASVIAGGGDTLQAVAGFEFLKQRLTSFRLTWMVEEVRKTQLLLEVVSLGRQQLRLKAQEERVISLQ